MENTDNLHAVICRNSSTAINSRSQRDIIQPTSHDTHISEMRRLTLHFSWSAALNPQHSLTAARDTGEAGRSSDVTLGSLRAVRTRLGYIYRRGLSNASVFGCSQAFQGHCRPRGRGRASEDGGGRWKQGGQLHRSFRNNILRVYRGVMQHEGEETKTELYKKWLKWKIKSLNSCFGLVEVE